jgi:hypothetical protein
MGFVVDKVTIGRFFSSTSVSLPVLIPPNTQHALILRTLPNIVTDSVIK